MRSITIWPQLSFSGMSNITWLTILFKRFILTESVAPAVCWNRRRTDSGLYHWVLRGSGCRPPWSPGRGTTHLKKTQIQIHHLQIHRRRDKDSESWAQRKHLRNSINTWTMPAEGWTGVRGGLYNSEQNRLCWSSLRCGRAAFRACTNMSHLLCHQSAANIPQLLLFSVLGRVSQNTTLVTFLQVHLSSYENVIHETDSCLKAIDVAQAGVTAYLRIRPQICCGFKGHVCPHKSNSCIINSKKTTPDPSSEPSYLITLSYS